MVQKMSLWREQEGDPVIKEGRRGSNTHLGLRSGPSCPGREEGDMGGGGLCGRD